ncbi:L-tyrosine/L-tryptophan isonitrile synthase family protein [Leifsonia sp. ZF2019]|nr:L-tyrosine/L-tryptophan isonitrile synthase family protein [Leifsonia sp. ZF2019]
MHVLNDPLFRKGSAEHTEHPGGPVYRQIDRAVRRNASIEIVLPSFAGRPHNPAAHRRVGPDLGELYALQWLKNIADAVKSFYEPGVIFTLILDGRARAAAGHRDHSDLRCRDRALQERGSRAHRPPTLLRGGGDRDAGARRAHRLRICRPDDETPRAQRDRRSVRGRRPRHGAPQAGPVLAPTERSPDDDLSVARSRHRAARWEHRHAVRGGCLPGFRGLHGGLRRRG